jgi:TolA-binding protein
LQRAEESPEIVGETHFLVGSLHVALAVQSETGSRQHWHTARQHLEQAQTHGVPETDSAQLAFQLGMAWAQTGETPQRVIESLEHSIQEGAANPTEAARGYALLAEAYLKRPQPDLEAALGATEKALLQPIDRDDLLAPVRLRRGELLLRLQRSEEAREVLRNIGAKAAPELVAQARRLRVRSLEVDEAWEEAALTWREILDDPRSPPRDRQVVLFHLGRCLRRVGQDNEAAQAWEECLRLDVAGDEVPAAALGLAELRLQQQKMLPAFQAFEKAVRDVKSPSDWHNELVSLKEARDIFETGCRVAREEARDEFPIRLARLYDRLALPGRAAELRGLAAEAAARDRLEQAQKAGTADAARLRSEGKALLFQAGRAYEQSAAALTPASADQVERLWQAATCYAEGREHQRALEALDQFLRGVKLLEGSNPSRFPSRLGEGWYRLAEAHQSLGHEDAAQAAFRECLKWPGKYAYRARYHMAMAAKARGKLDVAEEILKDNLKLMRESRQERDAEAREKTLFALGELSYERRDGLREALPTAINCLESALEHFPNNSQAARARYMLAESYRLLADHLSHSIGLEVSLSIDARLRIEREIAQRRSQAAANYQKLTEILHEKSARDPDEDALLVYASFTSADCRFMLGEYEAAGELYESLVERYKDRPERYNALAGVVRCYSIPNSRSAAKAVMALEDIRSHLDQLDGPTRQEFEKWLKAFDHPVSPSR